ncbi:MAG TPA: hypothetical protein VNP04_15495 [Alphaproteobacteria bacterium]|nr:hypothetical protein [Alphaproteobacteria bacterium]
MDEGLFQRILDELAREWLMDFSADPLYEALARAVLERYLAEKEEVCRH